MDEINEHLMIDQLRECGLRATGQRLAILRALREDRSHPSAEDIYVHLKATNPTLSLSTVYKTLQTLAARGVLDMIETGTGKQRFEGNLHPHHHAVCSRCGCVLDVDYQRFPVKPPEIAVRPDFTVKSVKIYFNGWCHRCNGRKG